MTVRRARAGSYWRPFLRLLRPHRGHVLLQAWVALLLVAMEGLGLGAVLVFLAGVPGSGAVARWLGRLASAFSSSSASARIRAAAVALLLVFLGRSVLQFLQNALGFRLRRQVQQETQFRLISSLHQLPVGLIQKQKSGALLTLIGSHVQQLGWLVYQASQGITSLMILLGCLALAASLSLPLTLISLLLLVPITLIVRPLLGADLRQAGRKTVDLSKALLALIQDDLAGLKVIHLFDRNQWSLARARVALDSLHAAGCRSDRLASRSRPLLTLLLAAGLATLMTAASFVLGGDPHVVLSSLALFLGIAFRLLSPLNALASFQAQLVQAAPLLEEIEEFLATAGRKAIPDGDIAFPGLRQAVVFRSVSFRYGADDPLALRDVELALPLGKTVAVVGASGAGKSSLVNLLARLYDPSGGEILVDGIDLRRLQIGSWRRKLAVACQDVFLFHASIRDNLLLARPQATEAEMISACQTAQIHDFILTLPDRYETILEERGMRLSGGQRQRLALARALLVDGAELLILDEATSEVDAQTEEAIQRALASANTAKTRLLIAHRLSSVRRADRIIVMDKGTAVEAGTHDQLLANGGAYARWVQQQDRLADGPHER